MALQGSGAISLDDMHVEVGGTTGSNATINDADIRGLISKTAGASMAFNEWYGASALTPRIVFFGGVIAGGDNTNVMEYVNPASTGNATDFGDLESTKRGSPEGMASSTRGVIPPSGGGYENYADDGTLDGDPQRTVEYITIASTGNSTDFGDTLTNYASSCFSSNIRGIMGANSGKNNIEYVTIASTGDTTDFGNNTTNATGGAYNSMGSSTTRGLFAGGSGGSVEIHYVTISSTGDTTDFGNLHTQSQNGSGCSSNTRGLAGGGQSSAGTAAAKQIDYVTIASTGNAADFGDLSSYHYQRASASQNSGRGLWGGGHSDTNEVLYITIASTGNSTDFGDLTVVKGNLGGLSNSHGGIAA
jgi:hypothetical protein|tara:strand:+ start:1422 stop:2501 length:1080 start_codon:yes stop_codon:yes gene_type:complete